MREEHRDRRGHWHPGPRGGSRVPPVSLQEPRQVVEVLDRERIPEVKLVNDRLQKRVVDRARPELRRAVHRDREIGTGGVTQYECDDRDTAECRDEDEKPGYDGED